MKIQLWREALAPYHLAVEELVVKFNHIIKECRETGNYSPIEAVQGRVKKISSILEKAQRKGIPLNELRKSWTISRASASSASLWRILTPWWS